MDWNYIKKIENKNNIAWEGIPAMLSGIGAFIPAYYFSATKGFDLVNRLNTHDTLQNLEGFLLTGVFLVGPAVLTFAAEYVGGALGHEARKLYANRTGKTLEETFE